MTVVTLISGIRDLVNVLKDVDWRRMTWEDMRSFKGLWTSEALIGVDKYGHTWVLDGNNLSRFVGDREYSWEICSLGKLF